MRILRKRGNIFIWAGVGMIAGPWALGKLGQVTGVSLGLPSIGGGGG
jgi:hypothetical protein